MNTLTISIISPLLLVTVADAQLTTNLQDTLPYIERFAKNLDLEMPVPLTTNRVSRFYPSKPSFHTYSAAVWIDSDRWVFGFNVRYAIITTFSDRKYSLGSLTQTSKPPETWKAMSTPPSITETQALEAARKSLARLGYDENHFPVGSPRVVQEKPFHWYVVKWPWTRDPWVPDPDDPEREVPRPFFEMEIDGLEGRVTRFLTLLGSSPETTPTNFQTSNGFTNSAPEEASVTNSPPVTSPKPEK
jgi:hypothetical protein